MTGPYDDIIDLPHPISTRHPHMPISDRAAQFAPFAALNGYEAAIQETARLTDRKVDQEEDAKALLEQKLQLLLHTAQSHPQITVTYFLPDARKSGGAYITATGQFRNIDPISRHLLLKDGRRIPLDDINDLTGDPFLDFL